MDFKKNTILGRVLWVNKNIIYKSLGRSLYCSEDNGASWKFRASLPISNFKSLALFNNILSRFFRAGFHHLHVFDDNSLIVFGNSGIYQLKDKESRFSFICSMKSSKPLIISVNNDTIMYGEYSRNKDRKPIPLYLSDDRGLTWKIIHTFKDIRHIHGVFFDKYTNQYWITTGDSDKESSIWRTDINFSHFEKVLTGSQKYRAVQLIFDPLFIYFGSDAPDEANFIYRFCRETKIVESLCQVDAPVFFGTRIKNQMFFSTAIEKSSYKTIRSANIWSSKDGKVWTNSIRLNKSKLPLRIFQNGQILFPAGPGDEKNLWFWSIATEGDNRSYFSKLNEIS